MYNTEQYTSRTIVINDFAIDCRVSHIGHARRKWRALSQTIKATTSAYIIYEYNNILVRAYNIITILLFIYTHDGRLGVLYATTIRILAYMEMCVYKHNIYLHIRRRSCNNIMRWVNNIIIICTVYIRPMA
jgi:hypothetical protein